MSPPLVVPSAERIDLPTMGMPGPVIRLVALATKCTTPNPGLRAVDLPPLAQPLDHLLEIASACRLDDLLKGRFAISRSRPRHRAQRAIPDERQVATSRLNAVLDSAS